MKMMYARSNDDNATTQMHNVDFDDIVKVFKAVDAIELAVSWNGKANKKFTCWLG